MGHDIFVSYSTKDKLFVDALVNRLENAKFRCWYAPRDIPAGVTWPSAITTAIRQTPVMLLVFSESANASQEVSRELTLASNNKCLVIPVRIENVTPGIELEYHLTNRHWLDVCDMELDAALLRILEGVERFSPLFKKNDVPAKVISSVSEVSPVAVAVSKQDDAASLADVASCETVPQKRKASVRMLVWGGLLGGIVLAAFLGFDALRSAMKTDIPAVSVTDASRNPGSSDPTSQPGRETPLPSNNNSPASTDALAHSDEQTPVTEQEKTEAQAPSDASAHPDEATNAPDGAISADSPSPDLVAGKLSVFTDGRAVSVQLLQLGGTDTEELNQDFLLQISGIGGAWDNHVFSTQLEMKGNQERYVATVSGARFVLFLIQEDGTGILYLPGSTREFKLTYHDGQSRENSSEQILADYHAQSKR